MRGWDDTGQSNIDFLFGISVFLLTFIYAATFIPGLFSLYQPASIDLNSVAYRTSAMLAEDPGWYTYAVNGNLTGDTAWETHDNNLSRIGLAVDKEHPGVLLIDKINKLNEINYPVVKDKLGLNGTVKYDINISIVMNDTRTGERKELINMTTPDCQATNVESIERNILISTGKQLFLDSGIKHTDSIQRINISNMTPSYKDNFTIRIFNATGNIMKVEWSNDIVNPISTWVYGNDYIFYLNGRYVASPPVVLSDEDKLEVVVMNNALVYDVYGNLTSKYIWIYSNTSLFPGGEYGIDYFNDPVYKLKSVTYPATMRIEVWSYAFE